VRPVPGEHVELVERALVEEVLDALAGEHLALGVLALDRSWRSADRLLPALREVGDSAADRADARQARAVDARPPTAGCSSRSGTGSAASCSATATTRAGEPQAEAASTATSPSCSTRCATRSPSVRGRRRDRRGRCRGHGLDFDALQQRIHPAESRVERLAEPRRRHRSWRSTCSPSATTSLLDDPLRAPAAAALEAALAPNAASVHLTPATTDPGVGERLVPPLRGRRARRGDRQAARRRLPPDKRTLVKVKHQRTADCAVAGYRIHKDGEGVGSLLLGLFDDDGQMHSRRRRGVVLGPFRRRAARRARAADPRRARRASVAGVGGARPRAPARQRGGSRWNAGKDLSFVPIRMELVAEVTFGQLEERTVPPRRQFLRWRPDRTPSRAPTTSSTSPSPSRSRLRHDRSVTPAGGGVGPRGGSPSGVVSTGTVTRGGIVSAVVGTDPSGCGS
jgi:hypothetical protein